MFKKYSAIITVIVSFVVIFGAGFGAVNYFAKSSELQMLSMKVDYGFLGARASDLQKRMWALEENYGVDMTKWPAYITKEWKKLRFEWESIIKKLEIIFAQQKKGG